MLTRFSIHRHDFKNWYSTLPSVALFTFFMLLHLSGTGQASDILRSRYTFEAQRLSLYDALNTISKKSGYYFIYNSQIVENDRRVKLEAHNQPLQEIIGTLLNDPNLKLKVLANHILIYKEQKPNEVASKSAVADTTAQYISIVGNVWDENKKPLQYVSVAIEGEPIGTITNGDGKFSLKVPQRLKGKQIAITHIGYEYFKFPIELTSEQRVDIYLKPTVISLQEIIIHHVNPEELLSKVYRMRKSNYSQQPVYLTTFYRESVQRNGKYLNFSEAIFKIYKPGLDQLFANSQIKELKSRKVVNANTSDTLILKIKGGISTCLFLDIASTVPEFIDPLESNKYRFTLSDIVTYESRSAYAIFFEQRPEMTEPLYTGTIYVDVDNLAILGADFEINPKYIQKATEYLIIQKNNSHVIKAERFAYSVSYRLVDGVYYINHATCNLSIKARKKGNLFSSTYTGKVEMATCNIETSNVTKFERQETIRPQTIYLDTPFSFDSNFWEDYNYIAPEEKLSEALKKINVKIEKMAQ